ncbi:MAG: tetratricopeptide repeat protein [Treponema sp.]|jgi:tetratricopeptide (TPR) repeat protein|nr:tetratricopeptide repeat protein [Treponema sp.]
MLSGLIPILIVFLVLGLGAILVVSLMGKSKGGGSGGGGAGGGKRVKGRDAIIRDANKKLAQNPRDPDALLAIGDIYYQEGTWDLAYRTYETLSEMTGSHPNMNEFLINLRYGIAGVKMNQPNEAHKALSTAVAINSSDFDANYNLGAIEFQRKNYEKAVFHYQKAKARDPEHAPTLRGLGHSLFKMKKYKEALAFIRKAMDLAPEDKESLYILADCYFEANQVDQAVKIFTHLRADPVQGPNASLSAGTINMNAHQFEKAIEDFEIGLRHENIKPDIMLELKYKLGTAYLRQNEIGKAIALFNDVRAINPAYKDVNTLIGRYQELNANRNLQIYLMSPQSDFIALCRKIVMNYYARAKVKITNISVNKNDWADVLAEIDTPKWSDIVMFRFVRSQGSVGELIVRDFHSHIKEVKAGKGICITPGGFSEEAIRFTEARLIDLIAKEKLTAVLNTLDARAAKASMSPAKK